MSIKLKTTELTPGKVYLFLPKSTRDCWYIGRVKDCDNNGANTYCWADKSEYCVSDGDFSDCLYEAKIPTAEELKKYTIAESKTDYVPTWSHITRVQTWKVGQKVIYDGFNNLMPATPYCSAPINSGYENGDIVEITQTSFNEGKIEIVGIDPTIDRSPQTVSMSQISEYEEDVKDIPKFKVLKDSIWVRTTDIDDSRKVGDFVIPREDSDTRVAYYYDDKFGKDRRGHGPIRYFRKATPEEIGRYEEGAKTINDMLPIIEETDVAELQEFPLEGWCSDAKPELGHYLAEKFDMYPSISIGDSGYAWSSQTYWAIAGNSGKPVIKFKDISHFITAEDKVKGYIPSYPRSPLKRWSRDKYYKGDKVRVVQIKHSSNIMNTALLGCTSIVKECIVVKGEINSYKLSDSYFYRQDDLELVERGEAGLLADIAKADNITIGSSKVPPHPPLRFKKDDIAIVIACNHSHNFNIGAKVKIFEVSPRNNLPYHCEEVGNSGRNSWLCDDSELGEIASGFVWDMNAKDNGNVTSDASGIIELDTNDAGNFNNPVKTHSFGIGNTVKLVHSDSNATRALVGTVGWISGLNGDTITVTFLKHSTNVGAFEIRAIVRPEDLRLDIGPITNSTEDLANKRRTETDFKVGNTVEIINSPLGYRYIEGDIGTIISRTDRNHCKIQFNRFQDHPEVVDLVYLKVINLSSQYLDNFLRLEEARLGFFDPSRMDTHNHMIHLETKMREGVTMRPDTYFRYKPLKIKNDDDYLSNGMLRRKVLFDKPVKLLKSPIKLKDGLPTIELEPVVKRVNK